MNREALTQLTAASLTGLLANGQHTMNGLNDQQIGAMAVRCATASLKEIERIFAVIAADEAASAPEVAAPVKKAGK